ncbi:hypothetical protein HMPREF0591_6154 [Mycobacterium parascrofulaceum ATCC BAA-614]|uniref:Uncharacterized protein n=1 Tax=Mycobacterium parascrofulaceum ATCC BAA-614 TaxID=525368 RepID=D5PJ10_9MYCO|nr:hypothetical protein HMPREF0591_6154 [Mycobacterium parascrofulaceum ATCC BAA-614]
MISKSNTSKLLAIREAVTGLGITILPGWKIPPQRHRAGAGDIRPWSAYRIFVTT